MRFIVQQPGYGIFLSVIFHIFLIHYFITIATTLIIFRGATGIHFGKPFFTDALCPALCKYALHNNKENR